MKRAILQSLTSFDHEDIPKLTLIARMHGITDTEVSGHPETPAQFEACASVLKSHPEFRTRLDWMRDESFDWAILVDHWNELEQMLAQGRMREIACLLERVKLQRKMA